MIKAPQQKQCYCFETRRVIMILLFENNKNEIHSPEISDKFKK